MSDRWAEYQAGTLTPPVVVQHDTLYAGTAKEEHLVWVYTAAGISGPHTFPSYDAVTTLATIVERMTVQEEAQNAEELLA